MKRFLKVLFMIIIILLTFAIVAITTYIIWILQTNKQVYYAKDFGIEVLKSKNDKALHITSVQTPSSSGG